MSTSLSRALGAVANERGASAERRVLLALAEAVPRTAWLKSVRRATADEDARGIDIVADSDVGKLYLQVKSSRQGAYRFRRFRKRGPAVIALVVCAQSHTDDEVQRRVLTALGKVRDELLATRT